jgi:nucleotide-binding universal stress UspA family protein
VGVDFDVESARAVDAAIQFTLDHLDSQLHVLHVDTSLAAKANGTRLDPRTLTQRADAALERVRALCRERMQAMDLHEDALVSGQIIAHYRVGAPSDHLVQLAVDVDADLIVVGTHGRRGVKRLMVGSVAAKVLSQARCPVYVVRRKDHQGIGVVPTIEPPCAECVATRKNSGGGEWWCERHGSESRRRPHHYSYVTREPTSSPAPWGTAFD